MNGRLHYIDWLRVSAFGILIVYHCSVAFFPNFPWIIKSVETSAPLTQAMDFPRAWRLALLFFVSGMGTWFAFRACPDLSFLRERALRLGLPLAFAMCVIVAPQVWYERMYETGYHDSFFSFWLHRYFTEGKYPTGNFTWAHMWFVAYLLVMSAICYPVFRVIVHPRFRALSAWFEAIARSHAIYGLFLLPLAMNLALSPLFPRQTNALYNDGAWFAAWACWFALGFLIGRHHRAVIEAIIDRRWLSAWFAAACTILLYKYSWGDGEGRGLVGSYENMTVAYKILLFALAWSMILTLVGFAALHLNRSSAALTWLNHKIFPLYIVHQTVIVAALYHVLPMDAGVPAKLLLVIATTVAGSLAFCIVVDQLPWPLRGLVGLTGRTPARKGAESGVPRRA